VRCLCAIHGGPRWKHAVWRIADQVEHTSRRFESDAKGRETYSMVTQPFSGVQISIAFFQQALACTLICSCL